MSTAARLQIATIPVCFVLFTWFAYRPSGVLQLASMAACPIAACVLAFGAIARRRFGRMELAILAALVLSPLLGNVIGHAIRRADFALRVRPRYEAFIARVERGEIVVHDRASFFPPPDELADIVSAVHVTREDGALCFAFFWGGGFPVRHTLFGHAAPGTCARMRDEYRLHSYDGEWLAGLR